MISVRVGEDLKRRMERLRHVNWSEVVRRAIVETLERESARNLAKAVLLNERNVIAPDEGYSSVEVIRAWREGGKWRRG
ncbi:MAG: hypothetical protein DRO01_07300 [Thermoproteota archaeon]|nr:MAG: hypothetical protein DRO01_07300 [Candidatus Korarchaeota archaeon]